MNNLNIAKKTPKFLKWLICMLSLSSLIIASPTVFAAQPTVNLQTASPFAILSATPNITDSPTSTIIGNVGLYPSTGSALGLLCSQVTGTIYARDSTGNLCFTVNDPLLLAAKNHLTTAFTDASGRTPVTSVATELGGTTKFAGVYNSNSSKFQISAGAGALVLDGQGDASSVFIFQMGAEGTGLIVGPGSTVSLKNGAQACNVFWVLDTATIDTTAVLKGNVLALNSITVANGANIEGRLLARNGNVTLINDTISIANCAAVTTSVSTPTVLGTSTSTVVPKLPNAGIAPETQSNAPNSAILATAITVTFLPYFIRRKKSV